MGMPAANMRSMLYECQKYVRFRYCRRSVIRRIGTPACARLISSSGTFPDVMRNMTTSMACVSRRIADTSRSW